jgi:glycerol uptake facilitator protein
MSTFLAEIFGTMILIIFGGGVVANISLNKSKAQGADWVVVALGWGLGVAIAVYAVGQISGAHINPAVTLGLAIAGAFPWADVPLYILGQMIGAFLGGVIVYFHFLPHWKETDDPNVKLGVFSTDPAIPHTLSNVVSEIIGTTVLVFGILAIGANEFTEGLNPLIVGFLIVAIGLSLGGTTGYAINPARDLGPRLAHFVLPIPGKRDSNWKYAWIPVVGPAIGGMFGGLIYKTFFHGQMIPTFWIFTVFLALFLITVYYLGEKATRGTPKSAEMKN